MIVKIKDAVDTVIDGENIITSVITSPVEMKTQLEIYDIKTGKPSFKNPVKPTDQITRGAGRIISHNGMRLRPAQNCTNASYGSGLIFYEINKSENSYSEKKYSELFPSQIASGNDTVLGVHTYARTNEIEIVDVKKKRINLKRIYWIILKRIK